MPPVPLRPSALLTAIALGLAVGSPAHASADSSVSALAPALPGPPSATAASATGLTYADLVDLALPARIVARARVRKAVRLKPDQAADVPPGHARFYVETLTSALISGEAVGESLRFLADAPLDARGRPPRLTKAEVLVLARAVPGRPGELQLVAPDAMLAWSAPLEVRLRAILAELVRADTPPAVTGIRESLHVAGNLAGEGETQVFLATATGAPLALSIIRRPGGPPVWGVSASEIIDQAAAPPPPATLLWYRLACGLPAALPPEANISTTARDRRSAAEDYAMVVRELGPCTRTRSRPPG